MSLFPFSHPFVRLFVLPTTLPFLLSSSSHLIRLSSSSSFFSLNNTPSPSSPLTANSISLQNADQPWLRLPTPFIGPSPLCHQHKHLGRLAIRLRQRDQGVPLPPLLVPEQQGLTRIRRQTPRPNPRTCPSRVLPSRASQKRYQYFPPRSSPHWKLRGVVCEGGFRTLLFLVCAEPWSTFDSDSSVDEGGVGGSLFESDLVRHSGTLGFHGFESSSGSYPFAVPRARSRLQRPELGSIGWKALKNEGRERRKKHTGRVLVEHTSWELFQGSLFLSLLSSLVHQYPQTPLKHTHLLPAFFTCLYTNKT